MLKFFVLVFSLIVFIPTNAKVVTDPVIVIFDPTPVNDKSEETLTIKNEGDESVLIGDISTIGGDSDEFDPDNDCEGEVLSEGEECDVDIDFEPESKGIKFTVLKFETASYGGGLDLKFEENFAFLAGLATEETDLDVEPDNYEFENMETGDEETVIITLRNKGNERIKVKDYDLKVLEVGGIVTTKEDEFFIDEDGGSRPCGTLKPTLDAGESCTIEVTFAPEDEGYKLAALIFETDEGDDTFAGTIFYSDVEKGDDDGDDSLFGCSVGSTSFPIYLLVPLLMLFRRLRLIFS